ncbi:recombinase family protein [Caulobacter sp. 602-1]|uniref:recombinase family protein n=1 Tax=Caulobacter sp. 602-1 TaxID=2492472 RepID=UPI001F45F6B7|nr:recombinase family protein [Caulobacter sp. 602-1]
MARQSKSPLLPTRAALYLRVSTGRQAENDLSIPDQRRQLEAYCEAKGWTVAAEFVEPGASATDDRRPAFQAMIEAGTVKPPAFDVVLVHSFSRFFRDQFLFEFYARQLARAGVRVVSITQELGDDPMGIMMRQIMALFDEYQSRENAKHTLRAMKENARQGFWNGARPPLGYRVVVAEQRGAKAKKKLEVDPLQSETIRRIFRLAIHGEGASGPMGVKAIVVHLNDQGVRTRDGGRFGVSAIHAILTCTTYIGEHRFNRRVAATGEYKDEDEHVVCEVPPIVSQAEFQAVQDALYKRNPKRMAPRFVKSPILLGGICFCGLCGGAMTLRTGKNGKYRYYTCSTKNRTGEAGCKGITVPMDRVDNAVAHHLETRLLDPSRLAGLMENIIDRRAQWAEQRQQHIGELRRRASEAAAKLNRLYGMVEDGLVDSRDPSLKDRIRALVDLRDTAEAEAERAAAAAEKLGSVINPEILVRFAAATREMLRNDDGTLRRDLLRAVAQRVEITSTTSATVMGSKIDLLRTLASNGGVESAALDVRSLVPGWRALLDSNQRPLA